APWGPKSLTPWRRCWRTSSACWGRTWSGSRGSGGGGGGGGAARGAAGVARALGVSSGTDPLLLVLSALGVGPGTLVLTTAFTFFATGSTIARLGARAVVADGGPATCNLDPGSVEAAIAKAPGPVAGIVPVHLYGRLADMAAL